MSHPNAELLKRLYSEFSKGNLAGVLNLCGDEITFQIPGKSRLAGKYSKETFATGLMAKVMEYSGGSFAEEVHDIMATDLHAAVLATHSITRNGVKSEYRTCHIWRFKDGKPIAWYEYPRDLYQFDALWT